MAAYPNAGKANGYTAKKEKIQAEIIITWPADNSRGEKEMNNRTLRAAEEYKKKYYGRGNEGAIFCTDILEIADNTECLCDAIGLALEAGFIIGYRKAKRDLRRKKNV